MSKIADWFKRNFYVRIGSPDVKVVETDLVRFSTEGLMLRRIVGCQEAELPAGEYSILKVENPYGFDMPWGLVVGTDLGAALPCWVDWEEDGSLVVIEEVS